MNRMILTWRIPGEFKIRFIHLIQRARVAQDCPDDCPEENRILVVMLKQGAASSSMLCRICCYLKRGSLNNMKTCELVTHLNENESFCEKPFARIHCVPIASPFPHFALFAVGSGLRSVRLHNTDTIQIQIVILPLSSGLLLYKDKTEY